MFLTWLITEKINYKRLGKLYFWETYCSVFWTFVCSPRESPVTIFFPKYFCIFGTLSLEFAHQNLWNCYWAVRSNTGTIFSILYFCVIGKLLVVLKGVKTWIYCPAFYCTSSPFQLYIFPISILLTFSVKREDSS